MSELSTDGVVVGLLGLDEILEEDPLGAAPDLLRDRLDRVAAAVGVVVTSVSSSSAADTDVAGGELDRGDVVPLPRRPRDVGDADSDSLPRSLITRLFSGAAAVAAAAVAAVVGVVFVLRVGVVVVVSSPGTWSLLLSALTSDRSLTVLVFFLVFDGAWKSSAAAATATDDDSLLLLLAEERVDRDPVVVAAADDAAAAAAAAVRPETRRLLGSSSLTVAVATISSLTSSAAVVA